MWHQLAHRVGRSSQATPAAVDKFPSASNTKIQTSPKKLANDFANSDFFEYPVRTFEQMSEARKWVTNSRPAFGGKLFS